VPFNLERRRRKKTNKAATATEEEANYKKSNQSWIKVLKTSFNLRD
jgi:hypothetical protein